MPYVIAVVCLVLGLLVMVAGERDDSPGLGGIGLLVVVGAVVLAVRAVRRSGT